LLVEKVNYNAETKKFVLELKVVKIWVRKDEFQKMYKSIHVLFIPRQ